MGQLFVGEVAPGIEFDDRLLAHLKVVVFAKFRRNESFGLSWNHGTPGGGGRTSIWLHQSICVRFVFSGARQATLNRTWIDDMMLGANTAAGLLVGVEPADAGALAPPHQ